MKVGWCVFVGIWNGAIMVLFRKNFTAKNLVAKRYVSFLGDANVINLVVATQVFIIFINCPNFLEGVGYISNWGVP